MNLRKHTIEITIEIYIWTSTNNYLFFFCSRWVRKFTSLETSARKSHNHSTFYDTLPQELPEIKMHEASRSSSAQRGITHRKDIQVWRQLYICAASLLASSYSHTPRLSFYLLPYIRYTCVNFTFRRVCLRVRMRVCVCILDARINARISKHRRRHNVNCACGYFAMTKGFVVYTPSFESLYTAADVNNGRFCVYIHAHTHTRRSDIYFVRARNLGYILITLGISMNPRLPTV